MSSNATSKAMRMVCAIEDGLADSPAGIVSVQVDGTTVSYDRIKALEELKYWRSQAGKASGRKPKLSSINLGGAW